MYNPTINPKSPLVKGTFNADSRVVSQGYQENEDFYQLSD